jgi:hypothetical protein
VTLGDAVSTKSPMKMIYRKVSKNSVTTCHLSQPSYLRNFFVWNNGSLRTEVRSGKAEMAIGKK